MDHRGISNTVDSTAAFRVAGVATPVVLFGFLSLVRGKATEKIGYKNFRPFCSYFGRMLQRFVYHYGK